MYRKSTQDLAALFFIRFDPRFNYLTQGIEIGLHIMGMGFIHGGNTRRIILQTVGQESNKGKTESASEPFQ